MYCPVCGAGPFWTTQEYEAHLFWCPGVPEPEPEPEPEPVVPCEISIAAPDSAQEGARVYVAATIKNVSPYPYSYKTEIFAGATPIYSTDAIIASGSSLSYAVPFTMPGFDVIVLVWVEVWYADEWHYSNAASREVALYTPPPPEPEFAGSLTRKELDYDAVRVPFPVH